MTPDEIAKPTVIPIDLVGRAIKMQMDKHLSKHYKNLIDAINYAVENKKGIAELSAADVLCLHVMLSLGQAIVSEFCKDAQEMGFDSGSYN